MELIRSLAIEKGNSTLSLMQKGKRYIINMLKKNDDVPIGWGTNVKILLHDKTDHVGIV